MGLQYNATHPEQTHDATDRGPHSILTTSDKSPHLVSTQVWPDPRDLDSGVGLQILVELLDVACLLQSRPHISYAQYLRHNLTVYDTTKVLILLKRHTTAVQVTMQDRAQLNYL